ncbi:PREDICTED: docking protein 5-like isoform X2 [Amphimedon queenslandica]|uniref:PH domain-containing protein n=1 Tax=Amphimedon queenslandica TaxID=400682 RepID=A0A1X7VXQ6_AMPQE|nr:PREDICTED: docking protein 5-like isoform X2 [Amphimedon queenslandica]|eukprot:XP_019849843.1 PREDICTED: docking protein 5-like isoform X2 [Amphimedon queenslandica]
MNEDVVRRGYVKVSATKGLGNSLSLRQRKYWVVLKGESRSTKACIEIYKSEDDVLRKSPTKLVAIDQISRLQSVIERKELTLVMYAESVSLICSSRADHDDWLKDIESVRGGQTGGGGGGGKAAKGAALSTPDEGPFRVRLRPSPSLLFHGSCILEIQKDFDRNIFNIALFADEIPPRLIVKWQIDHIRQYGSNEIAFKFQSGSKSPTNVDWFILDTDSGDAPRIHRAVDYWAHHIVEQANNMIPSRSSSVGTNIRPTSSLPISPPVPPLPTAMRTSSIPNGNGSGVYQPLIASTVQPTPIYDGIDNRQVPSSPPPAIPPLPSSLGGSNSVYQPLTHTPNGMSPRPSQEYAGLSELTREPSQRHLPPPVPPSTSVPSQSADYMGLNFSSRDQPAESTYMDLNVPKT